MKKIALATVLALATSLASAVEVRLEGQDANGQDGTASQRVFEGSVKQSFNKNFAGDITFKQYRTDNTNALANRIEAGLTASNTYGAFTPFTRVAIGEKYASGNPGYGYYSVEPGVGVAFIGGVSASLGWRFQDAFANGHNDQTRTWRSKLGYDLTKNDNVYIGYDVQRGDSEQNITKIGYIRRF